MHISVKRLNNVGDPFYLMLPLFRKARVVHYGAAREHQASAELKT